MVAELDLGDGLAQDADAEPLGHAGRDGGRDGGRLTRRLGGVAGAFPTMSEGCGTL